MTLGFALVLLFVGVISFAIGYFGNNILIILLFVTALSIIAAVFIGTMIELGDRN